MSQTKQKRFNGRGFRVSDSMVMREIAVSAGVHPSELRSMLE